MIQYLHTYAIPKQKEPEDELYKAYEDYINFLAAHIASAASFLITHGIVTSKKDFETGEKCRARIDELKQKFIISKR